MAGRGRLGEVPPIKNERLFMLRNGRWLNLCEPVNYDRPFAGVNLAVSFADEYSKKFDADVGLIPCADGGSSLEDWSVDGQLYNHAVSQTKLAQRISEVKGILWHQGEQDSLSEETAGNYMPRFLERLSSLRKECADEKTPVVIGELGAFLADLPDPECNYFRLVNKSLAEIAASNPGIALAAADGLVSNGDNLHFDAKSLREFGRRYFQKYLELYHES
ncbi:acetylxylan esterase [Spirochaetia bacterium]|nr:acetylxylan esterase [Spirochaetia bacterium]